MSADKVLRTQRYSKNLTNVAGKSVDLFSQRPSERSKTVKPAAIRRRVISANQNFNWGKNVQFRIPQCTYIGDMYLVLKIAQPDANLRASWGANVIESFRLRNSGRLIQEHLSYEAVYKHFMETLDEEKRNQVLKVVGQQGQSAQTVVIPIFAFWNSWNNPNMRRGAPLQYDRLSGNEGLVVEFTVNPVGSVIESSATPSNPNSLIQSVELVFQEWLTDDALESAHKAEEYVYHAHDYKVRKGIACAANTDTQVDCTALTGHTKYFWVSSNLDTEANQQNRTLNQPLSKMLLQIDGREYENIDSKEELRAEALLRGGKGNNSGNKGTNYMMLSICGSLTQSGGLNSRDTKDVKLTIKEGTGADSTCDVVAVQDVVFKIQNGGLRREE